MIKDITGREINQGDKVVCQAWGYTGTMQVSKVLGFTDGGNVRVTVYGGRTWADPNNCAVLPED